jgi:predicted Zn-dependent peptidase
LFVLQALFILFFASFLKNQIMRIIMLKQNRFYQFCLVFFTVFCLAGQSLAFDLENKVVKANLSNGLTVIMLERHVSPTVSLYIRFRVGAVDETKSESGAAHLLEHMMFKGTTTIGVKDFPAEEKKMQEVNCLGYLLDGEKKKKGNPQIIKDYTARLKTLQEQHRQLFKPNEIDRLYTENGGLDMNASTGQDVTTYKVSLPANKIELWARIEADRLLNPVFREFYTERDVVMEERRQRTDSDPDGKLYEQFISTAYKVHPYGRPIIGWEDDLMYLSPYAVHKIYTQYTSPENIVIAVVGDISPKETLRIIEKYFGILPQNRQEKRIIPPEPPQAAERRTEVIFDANPMMIIGYHKPTAPAYEDYVFDVLETILTTGRTSRLYKKLVLDMQLAESISAHNGIPGTRYPNLFTFFAKPRHPHTNDELEKVILQEIDSIKSQPVTAYELSKAKNHLKMGYVKSLDSNAELASTLSYYELLLGDYRYFSDYIKNIDKVTTADIQRVAKLYLNKENCTVALLKKKRE